MDSQAVLLARLARFAYVRLLRLFNFLKTVVCTVREAKGERNGDYYLHSSPSAHGRGKATPHPRYLLECSEAALLRRRKKELMLK